MSSAVALLSSSIAAGAAGTSTTVVQQQAPQPHQQQTQQQQHASTSTVAEHLVLRLVPKKKKKGKGVRWAEDVVDNEFAGKKKSKKCCIFHRQRQFGEWSDGEDSDAECDCPGGEPQQPESSAPE